MNGAPICCGQPARVYLKQWFTALKRCHSFETGFACKVCKRRRIPSTAPFDMTYMNAMDAIRERAIQEEAV